MKKVAMMQSNYIPWKGYFDIINSVDEFIFFDHVQYVKKTWRNRNRIKTVNGPLWLTIPVKVKGRYYQTIKETEISDKKWIKKHWRTLQINYAKAKYFSEYKDFFEQLYHGAMDFNFLSDVNYYFITGIMKILNIDTALSWSNDYKTVEGKIDGPLYICKQSKATEFVNGPTAKEYMDVNPFVDAGIKVSWADYSGYREYDQQYQPFDHYVSILDLIFNTGPNVRKYMKSFT